MTATAPWQREPSVDLSGMAPPVDVYRAHVSQDRMRTVVEHLASSSRHVTEDHAAALAAARLVEAELQGLGLRTEEVAVDALGVSLPTIWTEIDGVESGPAFVFVAHYDTVSGSPGADDNASGVAGLLELARCLVASPFPAPVVLGAVGFEETGLFAGSEALAQTLAGRRPLRGMVSLEMIGFASPAERRIEGAPDFLAIVGDTASASLGETFHAAAAAWSPELAFFPIAADPSTNRHVTRSDHKPFWELGVPAVMATDTAEFRNPNYHKATDTVDTLDFAFMERAVVALLLGAYAWSASSAPPSPEG